MCPSLFFPLFFPLHFYAHVKLWIILIYLIVWFALNDNTHFLRVQPVKNHTRCLTARFSTISNSTVNRQHSPQCWTATPREMIHHKTSKPDQFTVCVFACMCVCMHECMHLCVCGGVCVWVWVFVCVCCVAFVCVHACMHMRVHACMHVCMHVCVFVSITGITDKLAFNTQSTVTVVQGQQV